MRDNDIDTLVEQTLSSIDEMSCPVPGEYLFGNIMGSFNRKEDSFLKEDNSIGKYAMAFAILLLINLFSFFNYQNTSVSQKDIQNYSSAVNEIAGELFSGQSEYSYGRK